MKDAKDSGCAIWLEGQTDDRMSVIVVGLRTRQLVSAVMSGGLTEAQRTQILITSQ